MSTDGADEIEIAFSLPLYFKTKCTLCTLYSGSALDVRMPAQKQKARRLIRAEGVADVETVDI